MFLFRLLDINIIIMADIRKPLGKRIAQLRKQKGLTQEQLSEMLDIAKNSLSNIESGRSFMSFSKVQKLIDIFEIEPFELFVFEQKEKEIKTLNKGLRRAVSLIKYDKNKVMLAYEYINNLIE